MSCPSYPPYMPYPGTNFCLSKNISTSENTRNMERLVAFVLQSFFEYLHTLEGADHFWHSSEAIIPHGKNAADQAWHILHCHQTQIWILSEFSALHNNLSLIYHSVLNLLKACDVDYVTGRRQHGGNDGTQHANQSLQTAQVQHVVNRLIISNRNFNVGSKGRAHRWPIGRSLVQSCSPRVCVSVSFDKMLNQPSPDASMNMWVCAW